MDDRGVAQLEPCENWRDGDRWLQDSQCRMLFAELATRACIQKCSLTDLPCQLRAMIKADKGVIEASWAARRARGLSPGTKGGQAVQEGDMVGEARPAVTGKEGASDRGAAPDQYTRDAEVVFDGTLEPISECAGRVPVVDEGFFNDFDDDFDDGDV